MIENTEQTPGFRVLHFFESLDNFKGLDRRFLVELAARVTEKKLRAGDILFDEGDEADALYIVLDGRFHVLIQSGSGESSVVREMGPGVPVGEIALMTGGRRNARVKAVEDSTLARLSSDDFEIMFPKYPGIRKQLMDVVFRRLRRARLAKLLPRYFGEMDEATFEYIEAHLEWVRVDQGAPLFEKNETGDSVFILVNGLLHVLDPEEPADSRRKETVEGSGGSKSQTRVLAVIHAGEIVGEMALLTGEKRSASIYAVRSSEMIKLSRESFEKISQKYPQVMTAITRSLVRRLLHTTRGEVRVETSANIAVLPISPGAPVQEFTRKLAGFFSELDTTCYLSPAELEKKFMRKEIAQVPETDPRHPGFCAWLSEIEATHSYVVFQCDQGATHWTRRCLSRADHIVLLGHENDPPQPGTVEKKLLYNNKSPVSLPRHLVLIHGDNRKIPTGTPAWMDNRDICRQHHIRLGNKRDFRRLARILGGYGVGLALGGGAAKGMAHIGVIRALEEACIPVDMIGGTSIGAIIGAMYAMELDYKEMLQLSRKLFIEIKPFSDYTLPVVSLMRGRKIDRMGEAAYGDHYIEDLWRSFFCASTNLTTSRLMIHRRGLIREAVRASSSLPGMVTPVIKSGELLVDGGVVNNLPGDILRPHSGLLITVEVNPRLNISAGVEEIPSPWKIMQRRLNPFQKPVAVPGILDILLSGILTGSIYTADKIKQVADVSLTPPTGDTGFLDFKGMEKTAEIGYEYTCGILEELYKNEEKSQMLKYLIK